MQSEPQNARALVWALPISLAATLGIDVSFSSSGYLDVSVHRVPFRMLWIHIRIHGVFPCGFPHSEIRGSRDICSSPRLFAAYHVFRRLSVPRHPPCALFCLTILCFLSYSVTTAAVVSFSLYFCLLRISPYQVSLIRTSDVDIFFLISLLDLRYSVFKVRLKIMAVTVDLQSQ